MLLSEPPATTADLRFEVLGFPVRVHPFFWLVSLFIGMGGFGGESADPVETLIWVAAVFVSILVHELGHAIMQRHFGGHPWITLYSMGGLSACNDCDRSPRSQIIISAAGPVAGFLFAAAVLLVVVATGHQIAVFSREGYFDWLELNGMRPPLFSLPFKAWMIQPLGSPTANTMVSNLLWINIWWGLLNLMPIYPLDGGQISRELFTLGDNPHAGIVRSFWLSAVTAAAIGVFFGLMRGSLFMALMFGYLAYQNYQTIQAYEGQSR